MARTPQINIGLFGLGTVGGSVYKLLDKNRTSLTAKLGFPLHIKKICEPNTERALASGISASMLTTKISDVLDDPEISIIVELIGDKPVAKEIMLDALKLGKHVVTANKAILAAHGPDLYAEAAKNEVDILFEAAVCGAIPILRSIREGFIADKIESVSGIINGTANFILTQMLDAGLDFKEALTLAQSKGYAEADPTADVAGIDSAHKLTILIALAFGKFVSLQKIHIEGITDLTSLDLQMAKRFGYAIKLLGITKMVQGEIEARVHPTMIPRDHMLASVQGAFNAVMIAGENIGQSLCYGLGAGGQATATAVVADIVEIARNIAERVPGIPPLGYPLDKMEKAKVRPMEMLETEYYLRFTTLDRPGVFSKVAAILGANHISISSVEQHGREEGAEVPIVVLTHKAIEKNVQSALREIDKLPMMTKKSLLIRIEK